MDRLLRPSYTPPWQCQGGLSLTESEDGSGNQSRQFRMNLTTSRYLLYSLADPLPVALVNLRYLVVLPVQEDVVHIRIRLYRQTVPITIEDGL
jgi:hypothetical protein